MRAVEKDADFVISSSSAYKGTTELERAKSVKTSDFSEVFLMYSFGFQLITFFWTAVRFFLTLFCIFFAVCAFFDSLSYSGAYLNSFLYLIGRASSESPSM